MFYPGPKIWDLVPNELKNLNLSMLSNSKSKDGSLNDIHGGYTNTSWASTVYNNIKKLVLREIKLYVIAIIIAYKVLYHF